MQVLFSFCHGCDGFEIVIGGWKNTYSVIREYKQEEYVNKNVKADRTQVWDKKYLLEFAAFTVSRHLIS